MVGIDYLHLLRSLPGLVVLLEPREPFVILDASDVYLQTTFMTREQVVGRPLFDVFPDNPANPHADGVMNISASLREVVRTGKPHSPPLQRFDVILPEQQGGGFEERWWSAKNFPVFDADGKLQIIVHSVEEATELVRVRKAEEAERAKLVEARNLYQAVYDHPSFFAGVLDPEGTVIDVNRPALAQSGFRREDVVGKLFWECGWWSPSPQVSAWVKRACEQAMRGDRFRGITPYYVADGSQRVVDFSCVPIRNHAGEIVYLSPAGMDITERINAEKELRATEVLESTTDGFLNLDCEYRFVYVNGQAERILDKPRDELIGRVMWEAYPGLEGTEFERVYRGAMEARIGDSVTAFFEPHQRWYEVHAYPSPSGMAIYFRNVTEQRAAQERFQQLARESDTQRRTYEVVLGNTPDLVYIFDLNHRFVYANESLLRMWGKTREEALGKTTQELGYPEWQAAMHDREIEQIIATRKPIQGEVPFEGATGLRYWDYIFAPVLGADGEVVAIAGTARDSTERREAEEAMAAQAVRLREADRAKDEFIATLAHELRNPLAPLRNSIALLRMKPDDGQAAARLGEMMARQVDHLVRLVDDLLEISRINRGDFALRKARVPLGLVVRNALETCAPVLQARKHVLDVSQPAAPVWVEADAVRLAQVIANLVDNAAKYTPNGGRIEVRIATEGGQAVVAVKDNGSGISPDGLQRVFDMFNRGDRSRLHGDSGLGIGLALAQRLVQMHDGTLTAASEGLGRGSEFVVRIPLSTASEPEPVGVVPRADIDRKRVLVVDDNRDAADSLGMVLKELGAEVRVAHGGEEALEAFPQFDPAAVLLDIGMPKMDGYQVARALRERFPDHRVSLIALTGWGQEQDRTRAREAGFDHHLVKPADLRELQALLGSL